MYQVLEILECVCFKDFENFRQLSKRIETFERSHNKFPPKHHSETKKKLSKFKILSVYLHLTEFIGVFVFHLRSDDTMACIDDGRRRPAIKIYISLYVGCLGHMTVVEWMNDDGGLWTIDDWLGVDYSWFQLFDIRRCECYRLGGWFCSIVFTRRRISCINNEFRSYYPFILDHTNKAIEKTH